MKIRKKQKINHGKKNKRKQKICHGLTRNYTERSHCIQSRKCKRRLEKKAEALATELHGKKSLHSEPDA